MNIPHHILHFIYLHFNLRLKLHVTGFNSSIQEAQRRLNYYSTKEGLVHISA